MNERDAFLHGIAANLYDDTPRLAFADWLDEHGEHARAEFIRVQCELEPMRDRYEIPRAAELHKREEELEREAGRRGVRKPRLPKGFLEGNQLNTAWDEYCEFRRGFPDLVRLNVEKFVEDGAELRREFPTVRRVVIHCLNDWGERLAACEGLRGVPELELACWYSDDDMKALASSPHLADLQMLILWLGRRSDAGTDESLCRIAAGAKAWPTLRELVLLDPEGTYGKHIEELVTTVNELAGRKLGVYERGYPETFPIGPSLGFGIPGRLPDGRSVLASTDHHEGTLVGLILYTFDASGAQTDEVIRVPLSPEREKMAANEHDDSRLVKHLADTLGFVPGLIRVKDLNLRGYTDSSCYPRRGHYDLWDVCGLQDTEYGSSLGGEHGFGGEIYWLVRDGQFVVGHDAWADKTGRVHST